MSFCIYNVCEYDWLKSFNMVYDESQCQIDYGSTNNNEKC